MSRKSKNKNRAQGRRNPALEAPARTVELHGHRFQMAEKVGAMAFMRLASLAGDGVESSDMEGLAALYDVCRAVFDDDSWGRYQALANRLRLSDDEILADVQALTEAAAGRPTGRPSASPDGPPLTPSASLSDAREAAWALGQYAPSERFPEGRPDLQIGVVERWEAIHPGEPLPAPRAV